MDAPDGSIPSPQIKVAIHRALRRQVLRDSAPLTARAQNEHKPVDDLAHHHRARLAAALRRRNQRLDQRPFLVRHVAGIAKFASVIAPAIFLRPHRRSPKESDRLP